MENNSCQNTRLRWKTEKGLEKLYKAGIWSNEGKALDVEPYIWGNLWKVELFAELGVSNVSYGSKKSRTYSFIGKISSPNVTVAGLGYYVKSWAYEQEESNAEITEICVEEFGGTRYILTKNEDSWSMNNTMGAPLYVHNIKLSGTYNNKSFNVFLTAISKVYKDAFTSSQSIQDIISSGVDVSATGYGETLGIIYSIKKEYYGNFTFNGSLAAYEASENDITIIDTVKTL